MVLQRAQHSEQELRIVSDLLSIQVRSVRNPHL
jgi:hypothetical protein